MKSFIVGGLVLTIVCLLILGRHHTQTSVQAIATASPQLQIEMETPQIPTSLPIAQAPDKDNNGIVNLAVNLDAGFNSTPVYPKPDTNGIVQNSKDFVKAYGQERRNELKKQLGIPVPVVVTNPPPQMILQSSNSQQ